MSDHAKLVQLRDAAKVLGVSYSTLKRWIHTRKIQTVKTQGGHHRIPESELDKHLHFAEKRMPLPQRRAQFRRISARNQLKGRVISVQKGQTTAHVRIDIGNGVVVTSSITNEAVDDLGLKIGGDAIAVIKASDVMVAK